MLAGPVMGLLTQRHPLRRSWLVLGIVAINMLAWAVVIAWPGRAPLPLLVALVIALGLGGPGSMIGFDFARSFNPPSRLGTATGVVNVGGFVASLVTIELIGLILDARTGGSNDYHIDDFRVAMSVQFLVAAVGVAGILRTRHLARRRIAAESAGLVAGVEVKAN
jgi:nitrate/nitrite transporter NarK